MRCCLCGAVLCCAVLSVLCGAVLPCAVLCSPVSVLQLQAPSVKPDQAGPPIEDLKLGQLIVKTRKGRLFRGTYQRAPAAIKVCRACNIASLTCRQNSAQDEVEKGG